VDGGPVHLGRFVGDGVFEFADAAEDLGVGIEEGGAGLLGDFKLPCILFELMVLPAYLGFVALGCLLPYGLGEGDGDGAGTLGVSGSTSSEQPEVRVLGSLDVVVETAPGVFEGLVRVAEGCIGPPAGSVNQVDPVLFEAGDLVA
jgi:hypothetical protein